MSPSNQLLSFLALVASAASVAIPQSQSAPASVAAASQPAVASRSVVGSIAGSVIGSAAAGSVAAAASSAAPAPGPSTTFLVGSAGLIQPSGSAPAEAPANSIPAAPSSAPPSKPKRPKTLLENSSTTIVIQVSSSIPAAEPTSSVNADFCNANIGLTTDGWNDAKLGDFLKDQANELVDDGTGIQDSMKQLAGGIGNYACGFDQQCEITGALSEACAASPQPIGVLIAMANFNNFFRSVDDRISEIRDTITNRLPDLANTFAPVDVIETPPDLAGKQASLGLTAVGAFCSLLPGAGKALGTLFSTLSKAVTLASANTDSFVELDPDFNNFADVSKSVGAVFDAISANLRDFTQERLDAQPTEGYADSDTELPSILFDGAFASPTANLGDLFQDDMFNTIGSFLINKFWNDAGVIVVKATQADFAEGANTNICEGDNIFPASVKFCDGDGNAFILQTPPTKDEQANAGLSAKGLIDQTLFDTPGFTSIGDFGLDVETITQTAAKNQEALGYAGVPSNEDFASSITALDPTNLDFKDAVFFNLPVCDFSKVTISSTNENACKFRFKGEELDKCLFSMKIMCGCQSSPPLPTGDVTAWPYDLADGGASGYCNVF